MKVAFHFSDNNYSQIAWISEPHECPHCGRSEAPKILFPEPLTFDSQSEVEDSQLIELYQCTYTDCEKFFIEVYRYSFEDDRAGYHYVHLPYNYSGIHLDTTLPEGVEEISPAFKEIYGQAVVAEESGLSQLAGMGYRKALEFLIKDYAIHRSPEKKEKITSQMLGAVINEELVDFPKLQALAQAASWIGNDQTHYEQRFSDQDVESMKKYIQAASALIAGDYQADLAAQFVEKNRKQK